MTNELLTRSVGELVVEQPGRSRVFEQFSIDYCCGGKKPLIDACASVGAAPEAVVEALATADRVGESKPAVDWSAAPLGGLIDHILSEHHAYLRRELPRLNEMADKVAMRHGPRFDWAVECRDVLVELRAELESHMIKEEQMLFPMIKQLEAAKSAPTFHCGRLRNPITVMEHEHDSAGQGLARMRELSSGYTPPEEACNTFRALLQGLAELEADLHEHIHEENNILFPRAEALEAELANV